MKPVAFVLDGEAAVYLFLALKEELAHGGVSDTTAKVYKEVINAIAAAIEVPPRNEEVGQTHWRHG
jgi:predicted carbohydrate-binding protein with CBM5 and CBM33 domain